MSLDTYAIATCLQEHLINTENVASTTVIKYHIQLLEISTNRVNFTEHGLTSNITREAVEQKVSLPSYESTNSKFNSFDKKVRKPKKPHMLADSKLILSILLFVISIAYIFFTHCCSWKKKKMSVDQD